MTLNLSHNQKILWITAFLLTLGAAFFFRTYPLRSEWLLSEKRIHQTAEKMVLDQLRLQIEQRITAASPQMQESARKKLVEQRLEALFGADSSVVKAMTARLAEDLAKRHKTEFSFRYLSEADPYYYYNLTQNVLTTGKLGPQVQGGRFLNPLRHAPQGNPDVINLHPYVGAGVYWVLKIIRPSLTLMQAAGLTPLFLITAAAGVYFALASLIGLRVFSFWLAAQIFFLAPIVIQRSTLGWYDTDPYNLIFPAAITWTLLMVLKEQRHAVPLALTGAFMTGFYPLFWQGWTYMLALVSCASLIMGLYCAYRGRFAVLIYALIYTAASLGFAVLFMTPKGFWDTVMSSVFYSASVQGGSSELWPNLLVLVGETGSVTFKKWVYLTSHFGVITLAVLGVVLPLFRRQITRVWSAIVLMAVPLFVFSFMAERFAILAVFPLSLLAGYGIDGILHLTRARLDHFGKTNRVLGRVTRGAVLAVLTLAVMPRTFMGAHVSGLNSHFIMNDAWFEALSELGRKAPKDAIVHSWWPPGYFVNAISGLRTVVDGGSQHFPENFWMAKALMARDEKTAAGIFRMIATGGNQAMVFLETKSIQGDEAVELLLKMIVLPRNQAAGLLPGTWSMKDKEALLDLSHGKDKPAPSYVLIYADMLKQNLAMQVVDGWSFSRAHQVFKEAAKKDGLRGFFEERGAKNYTSKMLEVTGRGLPYEAPAAVETRQGDNLLFKNQIRFNTKTGQAFYVGPEGSLPVRSIFKREGVWSAVIPPVGNTSIAALVIPEGRTFVCVSAHAELVLSLIFKLAYLEGQGLHRFKSVIRQGSILGDDYVYIYRINWD